MQTYNFHTNDDDDITVELFPEAVVFTVVHANNRVEFELTLEEAAYFQSLF
jgi:hypothetical protein